MVLHAEQTELTEPDLDGDRLKKFAKRPSSEAFFQLHHPLTQKAGGQLIEAYAKHRIDNPHVYAVADHLQLPDENLLIYDKTGPSRSS